MYEKNILRLEHIEVTVCHQIQSITAVFKALLRLQPMHTPCVNPPCDVLRMPKLAPAGEA